MFSATPSRRLTEFLSHYLEFDEKKLNVGIWGGDLKLEDVDLKQDAFYPILNGWQPRSSHSDNTSSSKGLNHAFPQQHQPDLSHFLHKDNILQEMSTGSFHSSSSITSTLNIQLLKGNIGSFCAQIPWKSLLLTNRESPTTIEVRDLTLLLGFESLVTSALATKGYGFSSLYERRRATFSEIPTTPNKRQNSEGANNLTNATVSDSSSSQIHRQVKQEAIRKAQECLDLKSDIPFSGTVSEQQEAVDDHNAKEAEIKDNHSHIYSDVEKMKNAMSPSILDRILRSLASSLGWKVGTSLIASMHNIQIIIIQGGIEVGIVIKSFEINDIMPSTSAGLFSSSLPSSTKSPNTDINNNNNTTTEKKTGLSDPINTTRSIDSGNVTLEKAEKSVTIRGFGVFIHRITDNDILQSLTSAGTDWKMLREIPRALSDFIIQPMDIHVSTCIFRKSPYLLLENLTPPIINQVERVESVEPIVRRGKRDKRAKISNTTEDSKTNSLDQGFSVDSPTLNTSKSHPPQFETHINVDHFIITVSKDAIGHIHSLNTNIEKMKCGRPTRSISSVSLNRHSSKVTKNKPTINLTAVILRANTIKSWWHYAMYKVIRDVRKRRFLVKHFESTKVIFNWEKQSLYRKEYIEIYTRMHLSEKNLPVVYGDGTTYSMDDNRLLEIEDMLPVEQIILYRYLARRLVLSQDAQVHDMVYGKRIFAPRNSSPASIISSNPRYLRSPPRIINNASTICPPIPTSGTDGLDRGDMPIQENSKKAHWHMLREKFKENKSTSLKSLNTVSSVGSTKSRGHKHHRSLSTNVNDVLLQMLDQSKARRQHHKRKSSAGIIDQSALELQNQFDSVFETDYNSIFMDEHKRAIDPSMVTASISFNLDFFSIFICEIQTKAPSTFSDVIMNDDDISLLTFRSVGEHDRPCTLHELCTDKSLFRSNPTKAIDIGGKIFDIITSFTFYHLQKKVNNDTNKKLNYVFSIDAVSWNVSGVDVLKSGRMISPQNHSLCDENAQGSDGIVDSVSSNNFVTGELSSLKNQDDDINVKSTHSVSMSFSPIEINFDDAAITTLWELLQNPNFDISNEGGLIVCSEYDYIRVWVLPRLKSSTNSLVPMVSSPINLNCTFQRIFISFLSKNKPDTDLMRDQGFKHSSQYNHNDTKTSVIISKISLKNNFNANPIQTEGRTQKVDNIMLISVSELKMIVLYNDSVDQIIDPCHIELTISNDASNSGKICSLKSSPINISLSNVSAQSVANIKTTYLKIKHKMLGADLDRFKKVSQLKLDDLTKDEFLKVNIDVESFVLTFNQSEQQSKLESGDITDAREIMRDFLVHAACFPSCRPSEECLQEMKRIASGRIYMLLSKNSIDFVDHVYERFLHAVEQNRKLFHGESSMPSFNTSPFSFIRETISSSSFHNLLESVLDQAMATNSEIKDIGHPISEKLVLGLDEGLSICFEQLSHTVKISGNVGPFILRNHKGIPFISTSHEKPHYAVEMHPTILPGEASRRNSCVMFNIEKFHDFADTNGSVKKSSLSSDDLIERIISKTTLRYETNVTFMSLNFMFSDKDFDSAIRLVSSIIDILIPNSSERRDDMNQSQVSSFANTSNIDILDFSVSFVTDFYEPFLKLRYEGFEVDISSSSALMEEEKSLFIESKSVSFSLEDLTPEGHCYQTVVENLSSISVLLVDEFPFQLTLMLSTVGSRQPSEMTISLHKCRLFILRRFVNEILQYFVSGTYGLSHFLSTSNERSNMDTNKHHSSGNTSPLQYEILLNECFLILPTDSRSDVVIALESQAIIVSNSFHEDSWQSPSVEVRDSKEPRTRKSESFKFDVGNDSDMSELGELSMNDSSFMSDIKPQSINNDSPSFIFNSSPEKSSILRFNITAENVRIYTGISRKMWSSPSYHFSFIREYLSFNNISDDAPMFYLRSMPIEYRDEMKSYISDIRSRRWEEVTANVVQLEILADFLPTHTRLLIKDHIDYDEDIAYDSIQTPFILDLRMSQMYAILSVWYGNMMELPLLFPYSDPILENSVRRPKPRNWPEYGTREFVDRIAEDSEKIFETAVSCHTLEIRCSYDKIDYFSRQLNCAYMLDPITDKIHILLRDCVIIIDSDIDSLLRVGCGAREFSIFDGRRRASPVTEYITVKDDTDNQRKRCSIDMTFGLKCQRKHVSKTLPLPFQVSVLMTPDNWCSINVGMVGVVSFAKDLACVWLFLEYFGKYFQEQEFGNPSVLAWKQKEETKSVWQSLNGKGKLSDIPCLNLDFHLWLIKPTFVIPSSLADLTKPCLLLTSRDQGLFYRYKALGYSFASHELCLGNIDLHVLNEFDLSSIDRFHPDSSSGMNENLVRGLNMGLTYDIHSKSNCTNLGIKIPLNWDSPYEGIEVATIDFEPFYVPKPKICRPQSQLTRSTKTANIKLVINILHLKLAADLLGNFAGPYADVQSPNVDRMNDSDNPKENLPSYSCIINTSDVQLILCDPILGMHLPIARACVQNSNTTISRFSTFSDLQLCMQIEMWIDYFKTMPTRIWEPMLEPYKCIILYEKSCVRGQGISFSSECPFQMNVTSSLLEVLDFTLGRLVQSFTQVFNTESETGVKESNKCEAPKSSDNASESNFTKRIHDVDGLLGIEVIHDIGPALDSEDLVAFSLVNFTGGKIRFHQTQSSNRSVTVLHYLEDGESKAINFPATESVVKNLAVVEVPIGPCTSSSGVDVNRFIDIQVPSFMWVKNINLDGNGKQFVKLDPRAQIVKNKVNADWRLANAIALLTDVTSSDGARYLKVTSSFEIINKTYHKIQLLMHTDPKHQRRKKKEPSKIPNEFPELGIEPGEKYHFPVSLLEKSLHLEGSHLGSFWIRPDSSVDYSFMKTNEMKVGYCVDDITIGYSPTLQMAKLVEDSCNIYNSTREGTNQYQLSCPIDCGGQETASPFCYCVEVCRSPLVALNAKNGLCLSPRSLASFHHNDEFINHNTVDGSGSVANKDELVSPLKKKQYEYNDKVNEFKKEMRSKSRVHEPVYYSLVVHPPILIQSLLAVPGRFELMHAVTREVLWWYDVKPGESVPVHTVGLDNPLCLLLNLGYCCTPVNKGALVHHGSNYTINDNTRKNIKDPSSVSLGYDMANETQDYRTFKKNNENVHLGLEDIASEAIVEDSEGQKLKLCIENLLGGGGQRRITVYVPFWLLNTTEHSLRYKQEKVSSFVSGTVSNDKNGAKPVNKSCRNQLSIQRTIFPGKPGALSSPNMDLNELTLLLSNDIPLSHIANLAFMFNFSELRSFGTPPKLRVQFVHTTKQNQYTSLWSSGFSLESVGVSQVIGLPCLDGRLLEVFVTISLAPNNLSRYTKIVRFSPRYILVNQLTRPIRLWQDSSLAHPSKVLDGNEIHNRHREKINWTESGPEENDKIVSNQYEYLFGEVPCLDRKPFTKMPQGTTAHKSSLYIATADSGNIIPFHLPDTRVDREIRVDFGPNYNLTSSFAADVLGDNILRVDRVIDLRLINHVNTRAYLKYEIVLPPPHLKEDDVHVWDGDLGVWFETLQWGRGTKTIVKGTKRGKYAYNETDIRVGDELVKVDDRLVTGMEFTKIMKLLKDRLTEVFDSDYSHKSKKPQFLKRFERVTENSIVKSNEEIGSKRLVLTFHTLEHRMNEVRKKALGRKKRRTYFRSKRNSDTGQMQKCKDSEKSIEKHPDHHQYVIASTKLLNQSVFVIISPFTYGTQPYRLENRSLNYVIYYRQRGCDRHPWNILSPGENILYTWEEPMKPKKLNIRSGTKRIFHTDEKIKNNISKKTLNFHTTVCEEQGLYGAIKTVKLDLVGFRDTLPIPGKNYNQDSQDDVKDDSNLHYRVDTDGMTKVLIISDFTNIEEEICEEALIRKQLESLRELIDEENMKLERLYQWRVNRNQICNFEENESFESKPINNIAECDLTNVAIPTYSSVRLEEMIENNDGEGVIRSKNQLIVEVIEAIGLKPNSRSIYSDLCNPYAVVRLECPSNQLRSHFFAPAKGSQEFKTYYIENTVSPVWTGMKFIFDVPSEAVDRSRGYSIIVKLKDFQFGAKHRSLGTTELQLRSLRDEKEVVGWYHLMTRTSDGHELLLPSTHNSVRGSIKIRIQWIHSSDALLDYHISSTENRLHELQSKHSGISEQSEMANRNAKLKIDTADILTSVKIPNLSINDTKMRKSWLRSKDDSSQKSEGLKRFSKLHKPADSLTSKKLSGEFYDESNFSYTNTYEKEISNRAPNSAIDICSTRNQLNESQLLETVTKRKPSKAGSDDDFFLELHSFSNAHLYESCYFDRMVNRSGWNSALPISLAYLRSWNLIYHIVNDIEAYYFVHLQHHEDDIVSDSIDLNSNKGYVSAFDSTLFDEMVLPSIATFIMHQKNETFLHALQKSRDLFERAAQRSFMAVLNPGGWLKIRPIAALNLPTDDLSGVYVKVQYGASSYKTSVVRAASPEWCNEDSPDNKDLNDLEVFVEPLKTSGNLLLSVFGMRMNSNAKVELGVLEIQLANAISCCTEAHRREGDKYIRWFPLQNPKTNKLGYVMGFQGTSPKETEKRRDNEFELSYYTPCIKLAIWWEQDNQNDLIAENDVVESQQIQTQDTQIISSSLSEFYLQVNVKCLSVKLIDSLHALELLSFTVNDAEVRYSTTKSMTRQSFAVGWIQLDHHEDTAIERVLLCPKLLKHKLPTVQVLALKDNSRSIGLVDFYVHVAVSIVQLDIRIEEAWLFKMWEFYNRLLYNHLNRSGMNKNLYDHLQSCEGFDYPNMPLDSNEVLSMLNENIPKNDTLNEQIGLKQIYIKKLMLDGVKVNLSYIKSFQTSSWGKDKNNINAATHVRHQELESFKHWSEGSEDATIMKESLAYSQKLPNMLSVLIPAISDVPIRIQGKIFDDVFHPLTEIIASLKHFYLTEMRLQLYKVIGSVDFVGNPTMVLSSFIKGAHDFVIQPYREFLRSPRNPSRLGLGVAKGTLSLFSHFFSGIFGFLSKISESGVKTLATLSFDERFKRWHAKKITDRARNMYGTSEQHRLQLLLSECSKPIKDITLGVFFGASGLVVEPYRGAKLNGKVGFVKGLGIGGAGLVAKPLGGVFDAFADVTDSLRIATRNINITADKKLTVEEAQLPCIFGVNNVLTPYNFIEVESSYFLRKMNLEGSRNSAFDVNERMRRNNDDVIILAEKIETDPTLMKYIVVTTRRIVSFDVRIDQKKKPDLRLNLLLCENIKVSSRLENVRHDTVILYISWQYEKKKTNTPQITVIEEDLKRKENDNDILELSNSYLSCTSESVYRHSHQDPVVEMNTKHSSTTEQQASIIPIGGDIRQCKIEGKFKNRKQLTRIHNALCCLTKQFNDLIYDTSHEKDDKEISKEGITSFGMFHFDEKVVHHENNGGNNTENQKTEKDELMVYLENLVWIDHSFPVVVPGPLVLFRNNAGLNVDH